MQKDHEAAPGQTTRNITLSGGAQQIQHAKHLIQQEISLQQSRATGMGAVPVQHQTYGYAMPQQGSPQGYPQQGGYGGMPPGTTS
jgi:hypothetical protein